VIRTGKLVEGHIFASVRFDLEAIIENESTGKYVFRKTKQPMKPDTTAGKTTGQYKNKAA
jgi:hypothetical protein